MYHYGHWFKDINPNGTSSFFFSKIEIVYTTYFIGIRRLSLIVLILGEKSKICKLETEKLKKIDFNQKHLTENKCKLK